MSFMTEAKVDLLALINSLNSTSFTLAQLSFSNPQVVEGSWRDDFTDRNTAVRVSGVEAQQWTGSQVITYDRLDLASLDLIKGFMVRATGASTVHDLLPNIKHYTGIDFTVDDLEDTSIVDDGFGNLSAVLSAKPTSLGWRGSVSMPVVAGGVDLDTAISEHSLPGLNYPTESDEDTYAAVYLYGYDFTAYFNDIIDLEPGTLSGPAAAALVVALQTLDVSSGKLLWNDSSGSNEWSLEGATVVSNGLNSPELPTNQAYKYVLGLELRAGVTIPKGRFYLHYNDPFDPNDF